MQNGAGGAIRTRTPLQTTRFELVTYTIPSLRHNKWRRVEDSNPWASSRRPPLSKRLLWATQPTLLMKQWRKGWDSNPRRFFKPQPFSRRQPSTGLGHPSVILCSGAGRRQEASSQDTPRSRDYKTSLSCSSIAREIRTPTRLPHTSLKRACLPFHHGGVSGADREIRPSPRNGLLQRRPYYGRSSRDRRSKLSVTRISNRSRAVL